MRLVSARRACKAVTEVQSRPDRKGGAVRSVGLALMAGAVCSLTAGCDGGPGFSTAIEVSNHCNVDVAVALSGSVTADQPSNSIQSGLLRRGETVSYAVAAVEEPGGDTANAWVVVPEASSWGQATQFHVADLPDVDAGEGQTAKSLVIQDDMCPS